MQIGGYLGCRAGLEPAIAGSTSRGLSTWLPTRCSRSIRYPRRSTLSGSRGPVRMVTDAVTRRSFILSSHGCLSGLYGSDSNFTIDPERQMDYPWTTHWYSYHIFLVVNKCFLGLLTIPTTYKSSFGCADGGAPHGYKPLLPLWPNPEETNPVLSKVLAPDPC